MNVNMRQKIIKQKNLLIITCSSDESDSGPDNGSDNESDNESEKTF